MAWISLRPALEHGIFKGLSGFDMNTQAWHTKKICRHDGKILCNKMFFRFFVCYAVIVVVCAGDVWCLFICTDAIIMLSSFFVSEDDVIVS